MLMGECRCANKRRVSASKLPRMRLKVKIERDPQHQDFATSVSWASADSVLSASDDRNILRIDLMSGEKSVLMQLGENVYPTDMHWLGRGPASQSSGPKMPAAAAVGLLALVTADGKVYFVSKAGKIEKQFDAHKGAVTCVRWNFDGSALATCGEDGHVKVWSRNGMIRSTLAQHNIPVYSLAWGPDNEQLVYASGKQLVIKSLQPNSKPLSWKAHDGVVLKCDWSPINGLIVSGGEDNRYKVWESTGRVLYSGAPLDYPVTAIAWSNDGDFFAVGGFNTLRLCDRAGWSYALEKPRIQASLLNLAWSADSTQIAAACGSGHILTAHVVDKTLSWRHLSATLQDSRMVLVRNVMTDTKETLEFKDRVIKLSMAFEHLIAITSAHCYVYASRNWSAPVLIDLKDNSVSLIVQSDRHFLLVDGGNILVYGYDGRQTCTPRYSNMRADLLNASCVSLSNDTLAIRDKQDEKSVWLFDIQQGGGKPLSEKPFEHKNPILELALDHCGPAGERQLAFIDKQHDLYLAQTRVFGGNRRVVKLATMVINLVWNNQANILAGLTNGKLVVWYYPQVVFLDRELLPKTLEERDDSELGKSPTLAHFVGSELSVKRADGTQTNVGISPYSVALHQFVSANQFEQAVRLCRRVNDSRLWAALAAMSLNVRDLNTAEIAYLAVQDVNRVTMVQNIKKLNSKEMRAAEMALLAGNPQDAEAILLQGGHAFRAIMINLELKNFDRALDLAMKNKIHVDTVVAYRKKYLQDFEIREESNKKFLQAASQVGLGGNAEIDWNRIKANVEADYKKESQAVAQK